MKKLVSVLIILLFSSCMPLDEPKITIENNSKTTFDSIKVFTSTKFSTTFYTIRPNQKVNGKIFFDKSKQSDGCYKIVIYNNGNMSRKECFGYYTNGSSLNKKFSIIIEKDTIKVKSK